MIRVPGGLFGRAKVGWWLVVRLYRSVGKLDAVKAIIERSSSFGSLLKWQGCLGGRLAADLVVGAEAMMVSPFRFRTRCCAEARGNAKSCSVSLAVCNVE